MRGDLILPREQLTKYIHIKAGDIFSRQKVVDAQKAISEEYGSKGYMFSTITLRPAINDRAHTVFLTFDIRPGKRAYIRQISFSDNVHTNDVVLRREMVQMEAAPASTSKLEESKHRLALFPYIKESTCRLNLCRAG